jgi:hypothetical protein
LGRKAKARPRSGGTERNVFSPRNARINRRFSLADHEII